MIPDFKCGMEVEVKHLLDTNGMDIIQEHLDARKNGGTRGVIKCQAPGQPGIFFVDHEDGTTAAYKSVEIGLNCPI